MSKCKNCGKTLIISFDKLFIIDIEIHFVSNRCVSQYLPRGNDYKLKPHVYEMVLYEYLRYDAKGFLNLIKEWDPSLYNTSAVIKAVFEQFSDRHKDILLESLALLYSYEHKYEKALTMYLK